MVDLQEYPLVEKMVEDMKQNVRLAILEGYLNDNAVAILIDDLSHLESWAFGFMESYLETATL